MKIKQLLITGLLAFGLQTAFAQAPTITSFSPASGGTGSGGVTVAFVGANFTGMTASSVQFGGVVTSDATVTVVDDNHLTVKLGDNASGGVITLTNGSGSTTSTATFDAYPQVANSTLSAGDVVINKIYNSGTANGVDDAIELLVIKDHTNLQSLYIKDWGPGKAGGTQLYFFRKIPMWADLRSGTIIVLNRATTSSDVTAGGSDFNLNVGLDDLAYMYKYLGAATKILDIKEDDDMITLQLGGSGVTSPITVFGTGSTVGGSFAASGNRFRLNDLTNLTAAKFAYATNLNSNIGDYQHTGANAATYGANGSQTISNVTMNNDATPTALVLGTPNNATNLAYVAVLRATVLPVKLISFTGKLSGQSVQLSWATASENNSNRFEVLRSTDGLNFSKIKTVLSAGNSTSQKNYSVVDANPFPGVNYYKLMQYDNDGLSENLGIQSVSTDAKELSLTVYTSGDANELNYDVFSPEAENATVVITDVTGRQLSSSAIKLNKGFNRLNLAPVTFSKGVNVVTLNTAKATISKKLIK